MEHHSDDSQDSCPETGSCPGAPTCWRRCFGNVIYVDYEVVEYWRPVMQSGTHYFDLGNIH